MCTLVDDKKGCLDEQFTQLQQLQDESNPDFVFEVVTLFFDDSEKLLKELGTALYLPFSLAFHFFIGYRLCRLKRLNFFHCLCFFGYYK